MDIALQVVFNLCNRHFMIIFTRDPMYHRASAHGVMGGIVAISGST